jgi:hypothetical protein
MNFEPSSIDWRLALKTADELLDAVDQDKSSTGWYLVFGLIGFVVLIVLGVGIFLVVVQLIAATVTWLENHGLKRTWVWLKQLPKSKLVILCGASVFVLCGLFPPWLDVTPQGHSRALAYSFILTPPANGGYGTRLDMARLAVEWLCVAVTTGTIWLLVSKKGAGASPKISSPPFIKN